jgi:predicted O-methyltransferase YrrM
VIPPLVERATALAAELGFDESSAPETGRLLHLLAAQRGRERVAEIGTGVGVGAAWLAAGLAPGVPLFTAEPDGERARAAAALLADDPDVHVLRGPWRDVLPEHGPFDLVVHHGGGVRPPAEECEDVLGLLSPGATVVLDEIREQRDDDAAAPFWLGHPRLAGLEVSLTPALRAIVCVRVL